MVLLLEAAVDKEVAERDVERLAGLGQEAERRGRGIVILGEESALLEVVAEKFVEGGEGGRLVEQVAESFVEGTDGSPGRDHCQLALVR